MALPAFLVPALVGGLVTAATSLVGRVVLALGLGVVSYVGVNAGIDVFRGYFNSAMGSAGAIMAGMAGVLQLDVVLSIFVAAGLARLAINGATSGSLKRFTLK
jgi:hypothetical protein